MKKYIKPVANISNSTLPNMVITCSGNGSASETHQGATGDGHKEETDGMGGTGGDNDFTQGAKNRFYI